MRLLLLFFFLPQFSLAQISQNFLEEEQPVYELGAGLITLNIPDYPGSNNNQFRFIPFPYFIYRGKYIRADDEGNRARLLSTRRSELGLSFSLNFPVNSNDNPSRVGMPDLDLLFGIGPRLLYRLITDAPNTRLNLSLGARPLFSTNFGDRFRFEGWAIEPSLSFWHRFASTETTFFSSIGFEFGSVELTRFFYEVKPQFATPSRPAYGSHAGLIESSLSIGAGQTFYKNWFVFASASYRNLDWSNNRNSPLIETKENLGFVVGFVWTFFESEQKVKRLTELSL